MNFGCEYMIEEVFAAPHYDKAEGYRHTTQGGTWKEHTYCVFLIAKAKPRDTATIAKLLSCNRDHHSLDAFPYMYVNMAWVELPRGTQFRSGTGNFSLITQGKKVRFVGFSQMHRYEHNSATRRKLQTCRNWRNDNRGKQKISKDMEDAATILGSPELWHKQPGFECLQDLMEHAGRARRLKNHPLMDLSKYLNSYEADQLDGASLWKLDTSEEEEDDLQGFHDEDPDEEAAPASGVAEPEVAP
jgi:hypothetical protein